MHSIIRRFTATAILSVLLSACSLIAPNPPDVEILPTDNMASLVSFDLYVDNGIIHSLIATTDDHDQTRIHYRQSVDNGRNWTGNIDLSQLLDSRLESRLGNDIQLAAHGNQLMVAWQVEGELPGMGPLRTFNSSDGGKSWLVGSNPSPGIADQSHADLAADSTGRFHLIWLDDKDENGYQGLRYARSNDLGKHWYSQTIDDSSCSCCWNRLLITSDGRLNALYRDMEPRDMSLAQSDNGGESWHRSSTVGSFEWNFDGCPHNGGALAAIDPLHLHSLVWTGVDQKAGLYHLKSNDGGKTWTPPEPVQSEPPGFHSDIAALADGRLLAIWDSRGAKSMVSFTISGDDNKSWNTTSTLSGTNNTAASMPRVVSGQLGWLAMWVEQPPGSRKRLRSALIK